MSYIDVGDFAAGHCHVVSDLAELQPMTGSFVTDLSLSHAIFQLTKVRHLYVLCRETTIQCYACLAVRPMLCSLMHMLWQKHLFTCSRVPASLPLPVIICSAAEQCDAAAHSHISLGLR